MSNYTNKNAKISRTFWQDNEEGLSEQAIVIERFHDCIGLQQFNNNIVLTENNVEAFIKQLREVVKEKP